MMVNLVFLRYYGNIEGFVSHTRASARAPEIKLGLKLIHYNITLSLAVLILTL